MPPVTHNYIREASRFPRGTMLDLLRTLNAKYLLIHLEEYSPARAKRIERWLSKRPKQAKLVFSHGTHRIYELAQGNDEEDRLMVTPPLPKGARPIPLTHVRPNAGRLELDSRFAIDGRPDTKWATYRNMLAGDWFELDLGKEYPLVALDMKDFFEAFDAPTSYRLLVAPNKGEYEEVKRRTRIALYRDQVFHPRKFVYRIVLPEPTMARRVRIEVIDTVPRRWWSIHEMQLWQK
jgi:hypothetical protein